jgi:class 3 adenylate cyclase
LGASANYAAEIIDTAGHLRLTQRIYDALSGDLRGICTRVSEDLYQLLPLKSADLDALLKAHGLSWRRDVSASNIEDDKQSFPLKDITYSSAEAPIDPDALSITNNKRVLAASIFADVSGFTKYIDAAQSEREKITALRVLHAIRKELARVIKYDFGGLRIQYQGDRAQGLFHLPQDDEAAIAKKAVEAAVGLQSSMEQALKVCLPEVSTLRLAIGVDMGTTLVSKLGARGQRDRICLGEAVEDAAKYEERCAGGQIGVSKRIRAALPDCLGDHFRYNLVTQCYVATNLTVDKVEQATQGVQRYQGGGPAYVQTGAAGVRISSQELSNAKPIIPPRPYAPEA